MTLYLIRGLPGSGKSTMGRKLATIVCEADQYFIDSNGEYLFDKSQLSSAHAFCQAKTRIAMEGGAVVAVTNTFTRRWEMSFYLELAKIFNYRVVEISMTGPLSPNIHGVSLEIIEIMRNRWEL